MSNFKTMLEKIEEHGKFVDYKLDKIEILNQKADKQKGKEIQMMKEMEEKFKQQLRQQADSTRG